MANQFTQKAQNVLNYAMQSASELGHTYIGSEHLLLGLLKESTGVAAHYLKERGAKIEQIHSTIVGLAGTGSPAPVSAADMTPRTRSIIEASLYEAQRCGQHQIGTEHILMALLNERDCVAVRILENAGLSVHDLRNDLTSFLGNTPQSGTPSDFSCGTNHRELSPGKSVLEHCPTLKNHGRDLTALARSGDLDPIIGREKETERVIQILSRRTKCNPCLIGEPGVGKTAVVEGLAERIAGGNVPENLLEKSIVTLDLSSMIAGAKYRGEFEERFKNVLEEAQKNPDLILFIDEIHTMIGAGAAEGAVDAANIIKPALARGELQVIGATTITEYRKHIEKDAALERRFQAVSVGEPDHSAALLILRGLREKYEAHHKLKISDDALEAAIQLSARYITDRFLPDKAIDLIDEAASRLRMSVFTAPSDLKEMETRIKRLNHEKEESIAKQNFEHAAKIRDEEQVLKQEYDEKKTSWEQTKQSAELTVTSEHIAEIVTQWTGIPVHRLLEEEEDQLLHLEKNLKKRVLGQDIAVETVARAIKRGRMGLRNPKRPVGSFLFMGSTGIGKTELAKALAEALFGSAEAIIRLDMSEYMEKHSVSKLIGSPPGYVGFEEGGQLTEKIRRKPYSVILFDEIEKAHPDVFNILLQVLEDGVLTDSQGRTVNFRNTVIILTSNVGAQEAVGEKPLGFTAVSDTTNRTAERERMMTALRGTFRPEFLNRIDDIIIFNPLEQEQMEAIAEMMLKDVERRIAHLEMRIQFAPSVKKILARNGFDPRYGARPLRRAVVRLIEDPFSTELLEGRIKKGDHIFATVNCEKIEFSVIKETPVST